MKSLETLIQEYLRHLEAIGRTKLTVMGIKYGLMEFKEYLQNQLGVNGLDGITREALRDYQEEIAFRLTKKGTPLSFSTQGKLISHVKGFTRYLYKRDYLYNDPGGVMKAPKEPKRLPRSILDHKDIRKLMAVPDMRTNLGYRNRLILEILYDTGIRRAELAGLRTSDLDLENGFAKVTGKGSNERMVPLSSHVVVLLKNYLMFVRPALVRGRKGKEYLFVTINKGRPLAPTGVYDIVRKCVQRANLGKRASTHTFRHTCATHMLRNGAPIRHIQELLGHAKLDTTTIYTRVTLNDLKAVHERYHPSSERGLDGDR